MNKHDFDLMGRAGGASLTDEQRERLRNSILTDSSSAMGQGVGSVSAPRMAPPSPIGGGELRAPETSAVSNAAANLPPPDFVIRPSTDYARRRPDYSGLGVLIGGIGIAAWCLAGVVLAVVEVWG